MSAYTVPRMTRDIDIVVDLDLEQTESFLEVFSKDFYVHRGSVEEEVRRKGIFNIIDHRSGYKIDFVVKKNTAYRKAEFNRKREVETFGFKTWLVSAEDLILSKLIWIQELQSEKQMEDGFEWLSNSKFRMRFRRGCVSKSRIKRQEQESGCASFLRFPN